MYKLKAKPDTMFTLQRASIFRSLRKRNPPRSDQDDSDRDDGIEIEEDKE